MAAAEIETCAPAASQRPGSRVLMTVDGVGGVWPYAIDLAATLMERHGAVMFAVMGPALSPGQREDAARLGVDVQELACRLEWMDDPWADVDRAGEWLLALERSWQPDVIHLNGYVHAALPWRAPTVVVAHSCVCSWWRAVHAEPAPASWNEYRRRVGHGLRSAHVVVAPSRAMRAALCDEHAVTSDVRVIRNGRRPAHSGRVPSATAGWADAAAGSRDALILTAGRLWDEGKNVKALCSAAPQLAWPVYVAGEQAAAGQDPRPLPNVRHLGRLEAGSMEAWLSRASIYALPAKYEPFGLSVLEAAMGGCALVLGDIPSLRENWDGAALFVPPDDIAAITRTLCRLIDDAGARSALGLQALARAQSFTPDRMTREYQEAYADASAAVAA